MAASVQCPVFVGKLSVEGKTDLTQVVIVEGGIDAFTAFIICDRVKQMIVHQYIVVTTDHFSDKQEIRMRCTDMITKFPHECAVEHVGNIQSQAVNPILFNPGIHRGKKPLSDLWIIQIQFDQFMMSFPAFIPESIRTVMIMEVDDKPVLVC